MSSSLRIIVSVKYFSYVGPGSWKNHQNLMTKTCILSKGNIVFHGPGPPKHPTLCTGWGWRLSSARARLGFGPGRHKRTKHTKNTLIKVFTGPEGWWCPPQSRRAPPWKRTDGKVARSCRTKSGKKINVIEPTMPVRVFIISKRKSMVGAGDFFLELAILDAIYH